MWNAEVYHSLTEICYFQLPRWLWAFLAWTLICSTENAVERSIWIFRYCFSNGIQPSWLEENYTWEEPLKHCRWSRRAFSDMRLPWKPNEYQPHHIHGWHAVKGEFCGQQIRQNWKDSFYFSATDFPGVHLRVCVLPVSTPSFFTWLEKGQG